MKNLFKSFSLVLLTGSLLISCGKDEGVNAPGVQEPPAINDIMTIASSTDRRSLVGRKVDVSGAEVQGVVGNYVFWAGDLRQQIPVVRLDKIRGPVPEHVRVGQNVKLAGTVRLVESVPATDPMWEMITERERADIQSAIVYVGAESVEILRRP